MSKIQVLDQITIDKIAAGEVIERPASIVKELTENAIDAGASAIVTEIKEGGISFIRITDNGCGIEKEEVPSAFLRHSTSKIRSVDDLDHISSLGFRGEALSSIAAVSQVELITKTKESAYGTAYRIDGGKEVSLDVTGAPDGTTLLIRQLFYNTPARRKFLKTAMTEASHVGDLITRLALSHPEVSFQFINNGQSKLHTSGNGNLKDVIYHVYGREVAGHLLNVHFEREGFVVKGLIGEPVISRGNRNFENYFINGRYVKSNTIAKAIEDAYKDYSMQHKYPFTVLHFSIDGKNIDVNVHPAKMEVRFQKQQEVYNAVYEAVSKALRQEELIPHVEVPEPPKKEAADSPAEQVKQSTVYKEPEAKQNPAVKRDLDYFMQKMKERVFAYHEQNTAPLAADTLRENIEYKALDTPPAADAPPRAEENKQMDLFEERLIKKEAAAEYKLIGQVFDTYWLVEFKESLYIIDQHAAHERVLYEKTLNSMKTREYTSQIISPPIVLDLSMKEAENLNTYMEQFTRIGFEIEEFGQESYAVRAIPDNLFGIANKELLLEMIDSLSDEIYTGLAPDIIDEKVASMSCKAAVKGNSRLSAREVEALISQLLMLDNPYHCPHGRPTIIAMTKREMEKKFKRIV